MKSATEMKLTGSNLPLWLAVGHFLWRAPARLGRTELPKFLARLATQPREDADFRRMKRLIRRWYRLPLMRSRDTCYLRSLALFRFMSFGNQDLVLHFGVDEPREGERLHGHAWVSLDGKPLNPPHSFAEGRVREIYRFSTLTGGASTSGAKFAAAMMSRSDSAPVSEPPPSVS